MKLKEKLANEYISFRDYRYYCILSGAELDAYTAGFEKARSEAAKRVAAYLDLDDKLVYDLLRMGEEEV